LVEGKFSAPRKIAAGMPQSSDLAPLLYSLMTRGTLLAVFVDDTHIYMTEKHEHHVLCNLQCGFTAVKSCELWRIKINEEKTQAIYFSRILRVPGDVLH
jgi:hypothetical protein